MMDGFREGSSERRSQLRSSMTMDNPSRVVNEIDGKWNP